MKYFLLWLLLIANTSHATDNKIAILGSATTRVMNSINSTPKDNKVEVKLLCIAGYKFVLVGDSLSLVQVFSADKQGVKCNE